MVDGALVTDETEYRRAAEHAREQKSYRSGKPDLAGRKVYQNRQQEKNDDLGERGKMHSASVKGSHYHRQEQSARDSRKGERERPQV